jgi:MoxR-like ATPase
MTSEASTTSVEAAARVGSAVQSVISGKPETVRLALTVLLAGGHLLIEDVPGVGKTMLAKSLARSLGCSMRRIQFTPDLLPGDVVGVSVFNRETRDFEFKPGAVFANIVLGDEINRASPKTQSALLECMEEGQVTVDGTTYLLGRPFMVLATQNPSEMEGTYPLPEAQRDRFMARVHMGYPDRSSEIQMLQAHSADDPLESLAPVTDAAEVRAMIDAVRQVYVAPAIDAYVVDLVSATRQHSHVRLGASPRAALHLLRAARASAALSGRGHVLPDDVQRLAVPVLAHRLVLTTDAHLSRTSAQDVVTEILTRVPLPASA